MKSFTSRTASNSPRLIRSMFVRTDATLIQLASQNGILNFSQIRHFASFQTPRTDANVSMPGYVRPATADMRSQEPIRPMTSEQKLNWSKQNKEFRYDCKNFIQLSLRKGRQERNICLNI